MASIREQYQATSTKKLKKIVEEEDTHLSSGKFSDNLKYTEGTNKFRIFPKSPGEDSFYKMLGQHWITIEDDNGKEARRTVNNSKLHGSTEKDIIEEYVAFCSTNLDSSDKEDADKIKQLTAYEGGLGMSTSWLCYAKKIVSKEHSEFGILELKKSIRDAMNKLTIVEDEDEAMETDPFTDPDDGKPIIVTYKAAAKAKDKYTTQLSKNASPLSDEELESFSKKTPLSQLDKFGYTRETFELALEGLRFFDEKYEINLFDTDEFQEIVTEMSALYSGKVGKKSDDDDEDEKPKNKKKPVTSSKPVTKKSAKEEIEEEDESLYEEEAEEEPEEEEEKPAKKPIATNKKPLAKKPVEEVEEEEDEVPFEEEDEEIPEEEDEEVEEVKPAKKPIVPVKKPVTSIPSKPSTGKAASMEEIKARLNKLKKK